MRTCHLGPTRCSCEPAARTVFPKRRELWGSWDLFNSKEEHGAPRKRSPGGVSRCIVLSFVGSQIQVPALARSFDSQTEQLDLKCKL